jgi:hypothetical protein
MSNNHRRFLALISAVAAATLACLWSATSRAEDKMVLGPRQFERDTTGKGAVFCVWSIYLSVQTYTRACHVERKPVDDAIDKAIAAIDEFIMQNSSLHPTPSTLQDFKRRAAESELRFIQGSDPNKEKYCQRNDLVEHFRNVGPEQIDQNVRELLATPREPTMNPCL